MKIISCVNQKGGVSKTTTAVNLAAILANKYKVYFVDTDSQRSASWWIERGGDSMPFDWTDEIATRDLGRLPGLQYDFVVIDTPPSLDSVSLQAVLKVSDFVLLPTPPSMLDLISLSDTIRDVVIPSGVKYGVLVTRVDPRRLREALDFQDSLRKGGIHAFHSFVRGYVAHERAVLEGVPITKFKGPNAEEASNDYQRVCDELLREVA